MEGHRVKCVLNGSGLCWQGQGDAQLAQHIHIPPIFSRKRAIDVRHAVLPQKRERGEVLGEPGAVRHDAAKRGAHMPGPGAKSAALPSM